MNQFIAALTIYACWVEMKTHAGMLSLVNISSFAPSPRKHETVQSDEPASIRTMTICCSTFLVRCLRASARGAACFRRVSPGKAINHNFRHNASRRKTPFQFPGVLFCLLFATLKNSRSKRLSLSRHSAAGYLSFCRCKKQR